MFYGRIKELKILDNQLSNFGRSILIYGKRRVGKTTLIKKALSQSDGIAIYYECLKSTLKDNIECLTSVLYERDIVPSGTKFDDIESLFDYLNSLNKKINLVIDEYSYLKSMEKPQYIDSLFQRIIDNKLININLILSGSHVGIMKDLDTYGNALFGRFSARIALTDFNYLEASSFYPNLSNYDKVAFYSVFGGCPYVLEFIDPSKSLEDNIKNLLLDKNSIILNYVSSLITSDISFEEQAKRIFSVIGNSRKKYKDIQAMLNMEANGLLSKQLNILIDMGFIRKNYPINKMKDDKKATYELVDNIVRFYYTYIYQRKSILEMISKSTFYKNYIDVSIKTFISYRFEDIVKNYYIFRTYDESSGILNIGTYYYDDRKNNKNTEFDIAVEMEEGFIICEVKYYEKPIDKNIVYHELNQIEEIEGINIIKVEFVSISGYDFECNYITGNDIYDTKLLERYYLE